MGSSGVELKNISVFPSDANYSAAIIIYNQAYTQSRPAFVAFPLTEEDVMRCLYSVPLCTLYHVSLNQVGNFFSRERKLSYKVATRFSLTRERVWLSKFNGSPHCLKADAAM